MARDTVPLRFWQKVVALPSGCWLWTASVCETGYGRFWYEGRLTRAHRFLYERLFGPIADGLQPDHLCRNKPCVNPVHMDIVTPYENTMRGQGSPAQNARMTHCIRGHPFDLENTYYRPDRKGRRCKACHRARNLQAYHAKRKPNWGHSYG